MTCFSKMRRRVEHATGYRAVAIQRSGKHHAWLALRGTDLTPTARQQQVRGIHMMENERTQRILRYTAETNMSRVGAKVTRRKRGVSMGSSPSPAKSGVVYRHQERRFLPVARQRRGGERSEFGVRRRYAQ